MYNALTQIEQIKNIKLEGKIIDLEWDLKAANSKIEYLTYFNDSKEKEIVLITDNSRDLLKKMAQENLSLNMLTQKMRAAASYAGIDLTYIDQEVNQVNFEVEAQAFVDDEQPTRAKVLEDNARWTDEDLFPVPTEPASEKSRGRGGQAL